jgi:hypothetical protein
MAVNRIVLVSLGSLWRRLRVLWRTFNASHLSPPLAHNRRCHPCEPNKPSNDTISYHSRLGRHTHRIRQLEAKPAIDDSKRNSQSTDPEMSVGPESAMRVFLEHEMMQVSKYGLEKQSNKDNYANDWMVLVELMQLSVKIPEWFLCKIRTISISLAMYTPRPKAAM